jgi:hypothetical protein
MADRGGVDPASVQYFELPFPQMTDALLQNGSMRSGAWSRS